MNIRIPIPVEKSSFRDKYLTKFEFEFGVFYVFDRFIIGEIREGGHYNWEKAKILTNKVYKYFGTEDVDLSYISNRIHSYSIEPQDWLDFFKHNKLKSVGVVTYNETGTISIALERIFSKAPIKMFSSLESAVSWVLNGKNDTVER